MLVSVSCNNQSHSVNSLNQYLNLHIDSQSIVWAKNISTFDVGTCFVFSSCTSLKTVFKGNLFHHDIWLLQLDSPKHNLFPPGDYSRCLPQLHIRHQLHPYIHNLAVAKPSLLYLPPLPGTINPLPSLPGSLITFYT